MGEFFLKASNQGHEYLPPKSRGRRQAVSRERRQLELVTLPSKHVSIRVCDELKSYKIGQ